MKERIKQFEASVNVSFNVSFTVLATSEEQARVKIDNLLEIMRDEATQQMQMIMKADARTFESLEEIIKVYKGTICIEQKI